MHAPPIIGPPAKLHRSRSCFIALLLCLGLPCAVFCYLGITRIPHRPAVAKGPRLEVRLIAETPVAGSESMAVTNRQSNSGMTAEVIHVERAVLLDEASVRAVWVWKRGNVVAMDIELTDSAKTTLADLTREDAGKRLAILIDGRIRCTPKIVGEMENGSFTVASDWTLSEVQGLADRFQAAGAKRE